MKGRLSVALCVLTLPVLYSGERLQAPGVPRFHQVDEHVYRGGQPTPEGLKSLAKLGVKTIIDLRGEDEHRLAEKHLVESLGMRYVNLPMRGFESPSSEKVSRALELLAADSSAWPVFVHCRLGKDRTGTVIACYRIAHYNWDNRKALAEARSNGMAVWQRAMQRYILDFTPAAKDVPREPVPAALAGAGK